MAGQKLEDISRYVDSNAKSREEPGIRHSYMASLATSLNYVTGELDPVWLMGGSAFAFRIFINKVMCPSAMSVFDFSAILPEVVEQAGCQCTYVSRLWDQESQEKQKREQAHAEIVKAIDRGAEFKGVPNFGI